MDDLKQTCTNLSIPLEVTTPGKVCAEHQTAYMYGGKYEQWVALGKLEDAGKVAQQFIDLEKKKLIAEMCVDESGEAKFEHLPSVKDLPPCDEDTSHTSSSFKKEENPYFNTKTWQFNI